MQQTTKMSVCLCPKSKGINLGVSLQHILLQNDQYKHLSNVSGMIFGSNLLVPKILTITQVSSLNSIDSSFKMADPSETPITGFITNRVGIIFYPPKPHRSRGTEIEFWTPCDMLYHGNMPTMFWSIRLSGIYLSFALSLITFGRSCSRQQRVNITSITVFWQILYMKI